MNALQVEIHVRGTVACRHQKDEAATPKTVGECLSIPREESYRSDHRQIEQAPFNAPVNGGGRTGVVVQLVQSRV